MDQRAEHILDCIINQYVTTAEPVGSRALSKLLEMKLSAATIRNVMSDLTDMELICQPYTSAGRIPTDKGYRYFVNKILAIEETKEDTKPIKSLQESTQGQSKQLPQRFEDILLAATRELAQITNCTSVVMSPQPAVSRLKKIELIPLSLTQVLVVLIMQSGMVRNKIVHFRETPSETFLTRLSHILCVYFEGRTISEIRTSLIEKLSQNSETNQESLPLAIRLGKKAFDIEDQGDLYIFGRSNICGFPEFSSQQTLEIIFRAFDDKQALVSFFSDVMDIEGVQIRIGNENKTHDLDQCSVLATSYGNKENLLGSIGVVGPTRLNYSEVISAIDYSSQKLSLAVSQFLD
ncbi:MAG: heat-inducible transcription repressor HrcA [SAR324 cluster bacterium]|uniref:Heat-inducible transcription repressor HrcA n=1 Tax=SAR324 cluster bacterium TaxID=2024889 RepID=A0A2A4T482_9DELT|nr:MAG: heat-inducible transcription repressor HrcA [SAR324 cluster bacterium]